MSDLIRVGSRDSALAVVQAEGVISVLRRAGYETELVTMKTTGDKMIHRTLDQMGGKGLFVKELDAALYDGRVDLTVHSLKDMPTDTPDGLPLAAVSVRGDARDVLVLREGLDILPDRPVLGCSSARRRVQLKRLFPLAEILPVRGNIQTRLRKLDDGQFDALVLAAAGLERLGLQRRISRYFSAEEILPAAGQGVIAVQMRRGTTVSCLSDYHDQETWYCAFAERAFIRALNGGCSSPVAAYAVIESGQLRLRGMYMGENESDLRFDEIIGAPEEGEVLGQVLAARLQKGERT